MRLTLHQGLGELFVPPTPILREDNWPLLTVSKGFFEGVLSGEVKGDYAGMDDDDDGRAVTAYLFPAPPPPPPASPSSSSPELSTCVRLVEHL